MRQRLASVTLLIAACLAFAPSGEAEQIVFDNTVGATSGAFGPGCCFAGMEVDLEGTGRTITSVGWVFGGQTGVDSAEIELAIFANDGPGGAPGTQLWSDLVEDLAIAAGNALYEFDVPQVVVPETITVVSRIVDSTPVAVSRAIGAAPTTGTAQTGIWVIDGTRRTFNPNFSDHAIIVRAIPEPSSLLLLLVGLIPAWRR